MIIFILFLFLLLYLIFIDILRIRDAFFKKEVEMIVTALVPDKGTFPNLTILPNITAKGIRAIRWGFIYSFILIIELTVLYIVILNIALSKYS